jgi:hypothetical protein
MDARCTRIFAGRGRYVVTMAWQCARFMSYTHGGADYVFDSAGRFVPLPPDADWPLGPQCPRGRDEAGVGWGEDSTHRALTLAVRC